MLSTLLPTVANKILLWVQMLIAPLWTVEEPVCGHWWEALIAFWPCSSGIWKCRAMGVNQSTGFCQISWNVLWWAELPKKDGKSQSVLSQNVKKGFIFLHIFHDVEHRTCAICMEFYSVCVWVYLYAYICTCMFVIKNEQRWLGWFLRSKYLQQPVQSGQPPPMLGGTHQEHSSAERRWRLWWMVN